VSSPVSNAGLETLARSWDKSTVVVFYVRQPVAPVVICEVLSKPDLATCGGRSLLEAFSNSMKSQETPCGKTLINPQLLKIHAKHAVVVPQIPALAAR
jgi:hypothetical protein